MAKNLGHELRKIREAQGLSLEEIAQKTRINQTYLKAIEADDDTFLPSAAQRRGFLRLYASELGVTLEDLQLTDTVMPEEKTSESALEDTDTESSDQPVTHEPHLEVNEEQPSRKKEIGDQAEAPEPERYLEYKEAPRDIDQIDLLTVSSEMFKAIGTTLRNRRELLSLSLDDIFDNIHIRRQYLEWIESGDFNKLPSPVQAKGMLSNYAEFLNLDTEAILLSYADALQKQRLEKQALVADEPKRQARELSQKRLQLKNFFSLDLLVIAGLFIAFAAFVIWGVNRIMPTGETTSDATEIPEVADILLATGSPTPLLTQSDQETTDSEGEVDATPEEPTPIFTPLAEIYPINILIIPSRQAWAQVTVDDEIVFEGRLVAGNAYDYSGEESIEIRTGNAGALQIYFNQEDVGSAGLIGQVADLIFTEDGLLLPTPTITPTITNTPQATQTPTQTPSLTPTNEENND